MRRTLESLLAWSAILGFSAAIWALAVGIVWQAAR